MDRTIYDNYVKILRKELVPALGCTEPIALAYAYGKSKGSAGRVPEHMTVWCSGNIIKNVKGVKVPNSGGMKGVEAAAVLGLAGGDPSQALEVLEAVTQTDIQKNEGIASGIILRLLFKRRCGKSVYRSSGCKRRK